jgi:pyroglutamyl-peptidase
MACVLVTGFEPFDGAGVNPAQEIVRALDGWAHAGYQVVAISLPCVFGQARACLNAAINAHQPEVVVAIGQAANRSAISLERIAVNFIDARIPDNAGQQPIDCAVIEAAPAAYFSTLPLRRILAQLRAMDIPAEISLTAGSYVCNELFYGLMHQTCTQPDKVRAAGFIHVPALPGQFASPRAGMPLDMQVEAVRMAIIATLEDPGDVLTGLGSEGALS